MRRRLPHVTRGDNHRVKRQRSAIRCGNLTASRTDSDLADFDTPVHAEYNFYYIKNDPPWMAA